MADNDYRNPWLDWGEPVEPTSGKSWDDWGVPIESPTSGAQPQPTPPRVDVEYKTPVQVNVVEEYKDETGETKVRTVRTVEDRGQTTSVSANGGSPQQPITPSQAPVPTPEPPTTRDTSYPIEPSGNDVKYSGSVPETRSSQVTQSDPKTISYPVTVSYDEEYIDEDGIPRTRTITKETERTVTAETPTQTTNSSNGATCEGRGSAQGGSPQQPTTPSQAPVPTPEPPTTRDTSYPIGPSGNDVRTSGTGNVNNQPFNNGGSPSQSGVGNVPVGAGGGSPSNVPPTITREYVDENGERKRITVPNPEYERAVREEEHENSESNSGGVPLQSGVGNAPVGAGGGSPTVTGGGSGSAANTTWGTEVVQQYPDDIPNHGTGNPDNIPKTIRQPYKDENGDIQYRTVPNPAYYAGQSGSGSGGSGSGSGGSIPFAGGGSGSGNNKKTEYYPDYAAAHKAIKGANYRYSAEGIRNEVESLQSYYNDVMNSMDGWTGMAKDSYQNAANSIKGKLTVIMNNINESLIPASEAAEDLDELLTRLEEEDKDLHLLLEELNKREVEYQGALTAYNHEPSTITETTTNPTTGEKETKSVANPKKETLRQEMNEAKTLLDRITEEVEAQQQLEAELCEEIDEKIELIRTLQANIETMNSYVNPLGSNYHNISTHENINNNYDDIINDLTLPGPSIPNQSDYHDGDNVTFDDGYGEVYTITHGHGSGGTGNGSMPIATEGPNISNDVTTAYDYPMITDAPTPPVEPPTSK